VAYRPETLKYVVSATPGFSGVDVSIFTGTRIKHPLDEM